MSTRLSPAASHLPRYLAALAAVAASAAVGLGLHAVLPHVSVLLVFLTAVLFVAGRTGLGPALAASIASIAAYNFFFTEPYYSLQMAHWADVATLLLFVAMAALTANLGSGLRSAREDAEHTAQTTDNLYALSRRLASAHDEPAVYRAVVDHFATTLQRAVLIRDANGLVLARGGPEITVERLQAAAGSAEVVLSLGQDGSVKLIVAAAEETGEVRDEEFQALAKAVRDQAGITLERIRLAGQLETTRLEQASERLRSALMSSLSHDLRTPLSTIIGAISTVRDCGPTLDDAVRDDLLTSAQQAAERLDRYIQNLLDMTRLEYGALHIERDWTDLNDVVASAVQQLASVLDGHVVTISIAADTPLVYVHAALLEQVLVNLLDNAGKHAPPTSEIQVLVAPDSVQSVAISVVDSGPGIPEAEREKVFERFYRGGASDRDIHGSGLGLTICAGLVEAHQGHIEALPGPGGIGSRLRITLPVAPPGTRAPEHAA